MESVTIRPVNIRKFIDKMGEQAEFTANRHHSFLSTIFSWAEERDYADGNPVARVKKFPEKPRESYIEDW